MHHRNRWTTVLATLPPIPLGVLAADSANVQNSASALEEVVKRCIINLEDIQRSTPGVHLTGASTRANPVYMINH